MTRRDTILLAVFVVLGLLLGAFVVTESREVEYARQWLRGVPPRRVPAPPQVVTTRELEAKQLQSDVALELETVRNARDRIADDGFDGALERIRATLATRGPDEAVLLRIEEHALRQMVEPESIERITRQPGEAIGVGVPSAHSSASVLAHRPDGLGDPAHPLRPLARAYLTAALAHMGAIQRSGVLVTRELADTVSADDDTPDAGALVDVLAAWASLPRFVAEQDTFVVNGRAPRSVCVSLCQELLDRHHDVLPLCDGLAEIAADSERSQQERALAAMALSELADIPVGLGWDLPRSDADGAKAPRFTMTREWRALRDLDAEPGFAARVRVAVAGWDAMRPNALSFDPPAALRRHFRGTRRWLDMRVAPLGQSPQLPDEVRVVADGSVSPVDHLSGLAGGVTDPAELLRIMERNPRLRLPLHHLLLVTGAAGGGVPPRRTATTDREGIVEAWRKVLELDRSAYTLRVARLERRLDGLSLLDERRLTLRAGKRDGVTWTQSIPETQPSATWTPPGALGEPWPTAWMSEGLVIEVERSADEPLLRIHDLRVRIEHSHGGGSSGTSGAVLPIGVPAALAPWDDTHSEACRRAYLVLVTPGQTPGVEWTLDDWRDATTAALDDEATETSRAWQLGDAIALLCPELDVARLRELDGLGPGVRRARGLAGDRVFVGRGDAERRREQLSARERAELAVHAPDAEVRAAMWELLAYYNLQAPPLLAEELLAIEAAEPGRIPRDVRAVMQDVVNTSGARAATTAFRVVAAVAWGIAGLLLVLCLIGARRDHGARGTAALLLVVALLLAQVDVFAAGRVLTPAFAGWALAALAAWFVGRGRGGRVTGTIVALFGAAALASALALLLGGTAGTAARIVSALAALAACVLLAPLAPALLRGLVPAAASRMPTRPRLSPGWRLGVRVAIPAAAATAAVGGIMTLAPHDIVEAALFYVAIAACFGGVLLWRISLGRDTSQRAMPLPFLAGLVVPGLVLLIAESSSPVAAKGSGVLADPLGPMLRVWIICALLFALVRVFDAARLRSRADAAAASHVD